MLQIIFNVVTAAIIIAIAIDLERKEKEIDMLKFLIAEVYIEKYGGPKCK